MVSPRSISTALVLLLLGLPGAGATRQQGTEPPTANPGEDAATSLRVRVGDFTEEIPTLVDPSAHYTLYLPTSYDPLGGQPVLLIFDPRGRARRAAEIFRPAAERHGWILVSSHDTRSDTGTWEPNLRAFRALWPEIRRFAIDRERIYTAGFSGGAMFAWIVAQQTGEVAGVISVGGRPISGLEIDDPSFVHWGAAGAWDFNVGAMHRVDRIFAEAGVPRWLEIFPGPHRWVGAELASQAVDWLELQAVRRELRTGRELRSEDRELVERLWADWWSAGERWEREGDLLAAHRRFLQMASSFEGLRDVEAARRAVERLEASPDYRRRRREAARADARVERYEAETLPLLTLAAGGGGPGRRTPDAGELQRALGIGGLLREAEGEGIEAIAARRLLHQIHTQASFYLPREWTALGNFRAARTVLELALEIREEPRVLVELARCEMRLGDEDAALEALRRAVDAGWSDTGTLREDPDFAPLRRDGALAGLLARIPADEAVNPSGGSASGSGGGRP